MALTAFSSRLGRSQGRIQSASGDFVFVLGDAEPRHLAELAVGDYVQVTQATDMTGVAFVRPECRLRVPASLPAGFAWEASVIVDGVKLARVLGRAGHERICADLSANVSKLSGVHEVGVRLELVSA